MKKTITLFTCVLITFFTFAQDNDPFNQEASPKIGTNKMLLKYLGIEFTPNQRQLLEGVEVELIYEIDEYGNPILAEINGVQNRVIEDSLRSKTEEIGLFNPRTVNGIPEPSLYFMKFIYPSYGAAQQMRNLYENLAFSQAKIEDFVYLEESNERLDFIIGGVLNQFLGNPADYLNLGAGAKMDFTYGTKNRLIYGLNLSFYGNGLKQDYPINSSREQFDIPPSMLLGFVFGKWFDRFNIQAEINYAIQNVTERLDNEDTDWTQLRGWSPGVVVNYPIRIGKQRPGSLYGDPILSENQLNLHFGLRYMKLSLEEATGMMLEFGVSYRNTMKGVESYELRN